MTEPELHKQIETLLRLATESECVEFKHNNADPDEIGEYISALSNAACLHEKQQAYLLFGVDDATRKAVGTSFKPSEIKVGGEALESWLARLLDPRVDFHIYETLYAAKQLCLFVIDAAMPTPVRFKGTAYIRVGSYKKKLADYPEKERKIWTKTSQISFENSYLTGTFTAADVMRLIDVAGYFRLMQLSTPATPEAMLDRLRQDQLLIQENDLYRISTLCAMLFASDISEFESLARKALRVITYRGKNKVSGGKEYVGKKGYAVEFEDLLRYIGSQLPTNEVIGQALRESVPMYPEVALRELVANAVIHQNFSVRGTSPMVEIFDGRIEITNPGKPLIDTLRFINHSPISRNEKMASLMRRMNFCEERGSGVDRVITLCEFYQLPAPDFIATESYTQAVLYALKPFREMNKQDRVRACYQHCCLKYASGEQMTNQSLRERFGIEEKNYPMVSVILADAKSEGLVRDFDVDSTSRKFAKYVPFWA